MSTILERSFKILEELASHPKGRTLSELSNEMDIPLSATHRLLNELIDCGYVRKDERHGEFMLTMQIASLGLRFLSASGVVDVAQPALERLALLSGELVRLAVVDIDQMIFVAKAQGATVGLRYDPEMGRAVTLSCSAAGIVWLSTKTEEEAVRLVSKQGMGNPDEFGAAAPKTIKALMTHIRLARKQGYALTVDLFAPGMNSMATPVFGRNGEVLAVLIIAGPMSRFNRERMEALLPALRATADELLQTAGVSPMFKRPSQVEAAPSH